MGHAKPIVLNHSKRMLFTFSPALGAAEPQPRIDPSGEHCLSPSTRLRIDSASYAAILTCPEQSRRIRGGGEGTPRACPRGGGGPRKGENGLGPFAETKNLS